MPAALETTQTLLELSHGDRSAAERLLPLVYDELRALAAGYLRRERPDHTLDPTALVDEACVRLINQARTDWKNRAHFFAIAARVVRRILVDHARARLTAKRGSGSRGVHLTEVPEPAGLHRVDVLALDEALDGLGELNARHLSVVELRFFGGLTDAETAHVLDVSPQTVRLDWRMARAWLRQHLEA